MGWDEGADGTGVCGWGTWTCSFPWEKPGLEVGAGGAGAHLKTRWPSCSPRLIKSLLRLASLTCQGNMGSLGSCTAALRPEGPQPQPSSFYIALTRRSVSNPRSPRTPRWMSTHHTLPEKEAIGCSGPNLEFDGLRYFRQAGKREQEAVGGGSLCLRLPVNRVGPREPTNTHLTS